MMPTELITKFQSRTLKNEHWNHKAHLWVALHYLRHYGPQKSLSDLREDIQQLNLAHGVFTTPMGGYHETRTRVWLSVLWKGLVSSCADEEIVSSFGSRDIVADFYESETLNSWQARIAWVEPDKGNLDPDPGLWGSTPPLISLKPEL